MIDFDVIIIGAATSGAYFADRLAKLGYKVKVIEKSSYETVYDITPIYPAPNEYLGNANAIPSLVKYHTPFLLINFFKLSCHSISKSSLYS